MWLGASPWLTVFVALMKRVIVPPHQHQQGQCHRYAREQRESDQSEGEGADASRQDRPVVRHPRERRRQQRPGQRLGAVGRYQRPIKAPIEALIAVPPATAASSGVAAVAVASSGGIAVAARA